MEWVTGKEHVKLVCQPHDLAYLLSCSRCLIVAERVPGSFLGSQIPACPSRSQAKQKRDCHRGRNAAAAELARASLPGEKVTEAPRRARAGIGVGSSRGVRGCCSQPLSSQGGGQQVSADCSPASPCCGMAWHGMEWHSVAQLPSAIPLPQHCDPHQGCD